MTIAARLHWMETESKFAHACPDLDQEYPEDHAESDRARQSVAALERSRVAPEAPLPNFEWYEGPLGGGWYAWCPAWMYHGTGSVRLIEPTQSERSADFG